MSFREQDLNDRADDNGLRDGAPMSRDRATAGAPSIGQLLRRRREEQGIALADVAMETRVSSTHLQAIEAEDYAALPGLTYSVGFVRSYARHIGLDGDQVAAQFRAEAADKISVPLSGVSLEPLDESRVPSGRLVIAGVLAAVVGIVLWAAWSSGMFDQTVPDLEISVSSPFATAPRPASAPAPSVSDPGAVAPAPQAVPALDPARVPPVVPGQEGGATVGQTPAQTTSDAAGAGAGAVGAAGPVVITANRDAWIGVYDVATGRAVRMGVLKVGESYTVPEGQALTLRTGRAGSLDVTVGGRAVAPLGGPDELVSNVSLDPAALLARGVQ